MYCSISLYLKVVESEAGGGGNGEGGSNEAVSGEDVPVNPLLIVRRSQRVIKPTKDIDLYLLSAQFGVTLEDSEGEESSDLEFAPAENSDGESIHLVYIQPCYLISYSTQGTVVDCIFQQPTLFS